MFLLRCIGSLLIASAIASSAYLHLTSPDQSSAFFKTHYSTIQNYLQTLPQVTKANITFFVKIYGLFEALIALLIVFQDYVGGVLYISTLLANVVLVYGQKIVDKTVLEMTDYDQCKAITLLGLIGIALLLCKSHSKQDHRKGKFR